MIPNKHQYRWFLKIRPAFLADILKNLLLIKRQLVNTHAGIFFVDPISDLGNTLLRDGVYEPHMEQTLRRYLRPGDVFVDVGANEGYFSVLASRLVKESGKVFAIEPQHRLQTVLRENLDRNKCKNTVIIPVAIAAQDGKQTLYMTSSTNTGGSGMVRMTNYPLPSQRVQALTLSTLFKSQGIQRCRLAKIDTEGFEGEVIKGGMNLLKERSIDVIALEYHSLALKRLGSSPEQIHTELLKNSYRYVESPTSLYLSPKLDN